LITKLVATPILAAAFAPCAPAAAATAETATGARTVVTDASGNAYIPDPQRARLVVLPRKTP